MKNPLQAGEDFLLFGTRISIRSLRRKRTEVRAPFLFIS
jgi:hypothetical protein